MAYTVQEPFQSIAAEHQLKIFLALAREILEPLAHGRRDMTALCTTLAALDHHSLSTKRPITVPLLRDWLQREMPLGS